MRVLLALMVAAVGIGCGPSNREIPKDAEVPLDQYCTGLHCQIASCEAQGKPPTTISGVVYAPNKTLPLFGVSVYVPSADPGTFPEGAQCSRCNAQMPGDPIVAATSDEAGKFTLSGVPSGTDIPLVITTGKWRKRYLIPNVVECTDNPLPAEATALPANRLEGELPKIAVTTGNQDALECLVRKIGVSDSEFTPATGNGRVQLYAGNGANRLANGTMFTSANELWDNLDRLKQYDMTLFSCEGSQNPNTKPQSAMDAVKAYADFGGRVFLSHFHNIWIDGNKSDQTHAPAVWKDVADCTATGSQAGDDYIDQVNNPKGMSFAKWLVNVGGSTSLGVIPITEGRQTCRTIDPSKAERWVYFNDNGTQVPQNFQFTTPLEVEEDARCGKVVMSDMHVSSGSSSTSGTPFPGGCRNDPMTPQEKALAFMLFEIGSCTGEIQ